MPSHAEAAIASRMEHLDQFGDQLHRGRTLPSGQCIFMHTRHSDVTRIIRGKHPTRGQFASRDPWILFTNAKNMHKASRHKWQHRGYFGYCNHKAAKAIQNWKLASSTTAERVTITPQRMYCVDEFCITTGKEEVRMMPVDVLGKAHCPSGWTQLLWLMSS